MSPVRKNILSVALLCVFSPACFSLAPLSGTQTKDPAGQALRDEISPRVAKIIEDLNRYQRRDPRDVIEELSVPEQIQVLAGMASPQKRAWFFTGYQGGAENAGLFLALPVEEAADTFRCMSETVQEGICWNVFLTRERAADDPSRLDPQKIADILSTVVLSGGRRELNRVSDLLLREHQFNYSHLVGRLSPEAQIVLANVGGKAHRVLEVLSWEAQVPVFEGMKAESRPHIFSSSWGPVGDHPVALLLAAQPEIGADVLRRLSYERRRQALDCIFGFMRSGNAETKAGVQRSFLSLIQTLLQSENASFHTVAYDIVRDHRIPVSALDRDSRVRLANLRLPWEFFEDLNEEGRTELLTHMNRSKASDILSGLEPSQAAKELIRLDPGVSAEILAGRYSLDQILSEVPEPLRDSILAGIAAYKERKRLEQEALNAAQREEVLRQEEEARKQAEAQVIAIHLPYLDYRDRGAASDEINKSIENAVASKSARKYSQSLAKLFEKHGREKVFEKSNRMRWEVGDVLDKLGIKASLFTRSRSWALWDLAKQYHRVLHPDEASLSDRKYAVSDGMTDKSKAEEIINRHVGWEVYANGSKIPGDQQFSKDILALLALEPNSSVTPGTLNSQDLAELGRLVREHLKRNSLLHTLRRAWAHRFGSA